MRSSAFSRSSSFVTTTLLLTLASFGCVGTVDGGGTGGSGGAASGGDTGTAGSDCGDTESTAIAVGAGGEGTSAVSGVGGYGTSGVGGWGDVGGSGDVGGWGTAVSSSGAGGSGGQCGTPPPVGPLEFCGGAVSAGSGMGNSCATLTCDQNGNTWDQTCDAQGICTCSFNSVPICACLTNPAGVCNGGGCCPAPWSS